MNPSSVLLILLFSIVLFGCTNSPAPVCNSPYILVGTSCCLDTNNNSICDSDEAPIIELTEPQTNVSQGMSKTTAEVTLDVQSNISLDVNIEQKKADLEPQEDKAPEESDREPQAVSEPDESSRDHPAAEEREDEELTANDDEASETVPVQEDNVFQTEKTISCNANVYNCGNFEFQEDAQSVFIECGGAEHDVHHLDRDQDGEACEALRRKNN